MPGHFSPGPGDKIRLDNTSHNLEQEVKLRFPALFEGIGRLEGEYHIKPDATPFALSTPRQVSLPLMSRVKEELSQMEELGIISRVYQPAAWCAGMVVVPKKDGKVRICVDLIKLDENVRRELVTLCQIYAGSAEGC